MIKRATKFRIILHFGANIGQENEILLKKLRKE